MLNKTKLLPFQCKTIMQSKLSPGWGRSKWKLWYLLIKGHSQTTDSAGGGNFPGKGCHVVKETHANRQGGAAFRGIMRGSQGLREMGKGKVFVS